MKKWLFTFLILSGWLLPSCRPELELPEPTANGLDFSRIVALGGGWMSGFSDSAWHPLAHYSAPPALFADRAEFIIHQVFNQPLVSYPSGISFREDTTAHRLVWTKWLTCTQDWQIIPKRLPGIPPQEAHASLFKGLPFSNISYPGQSFTGIFNPLLAQQPGGNFYYGMIQSEPDRSPFREFLSQQPTFFLLWLGMDEVLDWAVKGGTGDPLPAYDLFGSLANVLLDSLATFSPDGIIVGIPDVTRFPWFHRLEWNGLFLTEEEAAFVNSRTLDWNLLQVYRPGSNPFLVEDPFSTDGVRPMESGELLVGSIPLDSILCAWHGVRAPFPNHWVLDKREKDLLTRSIDTYNFILRTLAAQRGFAFADMELWLQEFEKTKPINGLGISTKRLYSQLFSSDELFPSPRGNALTANLFIKALKEQYGAILPEVDISRHSGPIFPQ